MILYTLDKTNTNVVSLYVTVIKLNELRNIVVSYIKANPIVEHTFIIYYFSHDVFVDAFDGFTFNKIGVDLEPFFKEHAKRFFHKCDSFPEDIARIYDAINTPFEKIDKITNIDKYKRTTGEIEKLRLDSYNNTGCFDSELYEVLHSQFIELFPYLERHTQTYTFPSNNRITKYERIKTTVMTDVYYYDRCWYDSSRNLMCIPDYENDFEYKQYVKTPTDISLFDPVHVAEDVMFCDYLYDFYNFGEFWDVVYRMLVADVRNIDLLHKKPYRVTDIQFYFNTIGFNFSSKYMLETRYDSTSKRKTPSCCYHFDKIYVTTICGPCRGHLDRFRAFKINSLLNNSILTPKPFRLYLSRGSFGRSISNESSLVDVLTHKYNFIVLNGSETREETQLYFTNASIMLGVHGSLMKNMIWCKNNPIFIELSPYTRSNFDMGGNATNLGLKTFFFNFDCDASEQITLTDAQLNGIFELLDLCLD